MARRFPARLILAALLVALAGCAGSGVLTWEPETAEERVLREQAARLQSTVGEGGLSGALIGALAGLATGNPGAAFAGARAGRLAGAGAGLYVRGLQADYADREARLARIAADIARTVETSEAALDSMRGVREQQRVRLAELRAAVARKAASADALARQQARARRNLAEMQRAAEAAARRRALFVEARGIVLTGGDAPAPDSGPARAGAAGDDAKDAEVARQLSILSNRVSAMRAVARALAEDI